MPTAADRRLILLFLAVVSAAALLRPLAEPDEGRYGEAAREMVASGDWLLPRQSGEVYPDKPPGVYWLMASAIAVLGPSAFAVRLPALLALALLALLVHRRARSSLGEEAATVAVLILLAEPLLLVLGQLATLDMVLSALVCAGMLAGRRLLLEGGWRSAAFCGAALGGAFLVKGPVGPALTLAVLLVTSLLERRAARALRLLHPALWLPLAAIGLPWYWAAAAAEPGLLDFWIGREVVGRLSSDVHARAQPLWFFPALVAAISLPWLAGLLSAQRRGTVCGDPGERLFHAVWAFLPVLLFTLPQGKQPAYYAPAVPGLALWLAAYWSAPAARGARRWIAGSWLLLACGGLLYHLDPVRGRSEDGSSQALLAAGAADWRGAQLMSWSYGLSYRLGRTDLEVLGPTPKAWAYAAGQGEGPERSRNERAFARAVELLGGPEPAFVLVHEPLEDGRNRTVLTGLLAAAGVEARQLPARSEATLFVNRY